MHDLSTIMAMNRRAERNRNIYRAAHDEDGHARLVRVIHTTPGCRTVQDGTACTCTREDDQRYHHAKMDRNADKPNPDDYPDEPEEVSRDRGFISDMQEHHRNMEDPERHCKACECTCSYCHNPVTSCVDFGSLCDPCKIEIYGRLRDADERQTRMHCARCHEPAIESMNMLPGETYYCRSCTAGGSTQEREPERMNDCPRSCGSTDYPGPFCKVCTNRTSTPHQEITLNQLPIADPVRIDDADAFTIESDTPLDEGDLFTYNGKPLYASTIILIIEVRKYPTDQVREAYNTTETITRGMPAGICLDCNKPFADRTDRGYLTCKSCRPC